LTTTEAWPNAQTPINHDRGDQQLAVLTETRDYTRRIHWWVRLFGVVWSVGIALGLLGGLTVAIQLGLSSDSCSTRIAGTCVDGLGVPVPTTPTTNSPAAKHFDFCIKHPDDSTC
jgi:hypothetical protein